MTAYELLKTIKEKTSLLLEARIFANEWEWI